MWPGMRPATGWIANRTLTPRFDTSYQSGFNTNAVITPNNRVPAYHLGNFRLTWDSPEDKWQTAFAVSQSPMGPTAPAMNIGSSTSLQK